MTSVADATSVKVIDGLPLITYANNYQMDPISHSHTYVVLVIFCKNKWENNDLHLKIQAVKSL